MELLDCVNIFSHLDDEGRKLIANAMEMEEFNDGDTIIRQGEKQQQFFVMAEAIEKQDSFTLIGRFCLLFCKVLQLFIVKIQIISQEWNYPSCVEETIWQENVFG